MPQSAANDDITAGDIAEYVRDMARELAVLAREAGLFTVAAGLEQAHRAAAAEALAHQSDAGNAAPDDAA